MKRFTTAVLTSALALAGAPLAHAQLHLTAPNFCQGYPTLNAALAAQNKIEFLSNAGVQCYIAPAVSNVSKDNKFDRPYHLMCRILSDEGFNAIQDSVPSLADADASANPSTFNNLCGPTSPLE